MGYHNSTDPPPLTLVLVVLVLSLCPSLLLANDADALQDFCVADLNSSITAVNGFVCKDAAMVTSDDFASSFIAKAGNTSNALGSAVTPAFVNNFPGVYTCGISMNRVDYAVGGLNPPHVHPRASELIYVEKGSLYVGFVTTENKLFAKTVKQGELFIVPKGLLHFQLNVGQEPAVAIAALTSENPGLSRVATATFASSPVIDDAVLAKAFDITEAEVEHLKDVVRKIS